MKKSIKTALAGLLAVPALALGISLFSPVATPTYAACTEGTLTIGSGANCAAGDGVATTLFGSGSIFTTIVNILLFIIGAISVIMLIIGGIRYTVSGGDSSAVTGAKNTILYAIIGLVVAFLAFAVVNWVLGSLTSNTN
jgi:Type IV secretion system pilin